VLEAFLASSVPCSQPVADALQQLHLAVELLELLELVELVVALVTRI
jgi:hypothetical protein